MGLDEDEEDNQASALQHGTVASGHAAASSSHVPKASGQPPVSTPAQFRRLPTSGDTNFDPDPLSKGELLKGRAEFKGADTSNVELRRMFANARATCLKHQQTTARQKLESLRMVMTTKRSGVWVANMNKQT